MDTKKMKKRLAHLRSIASKGGLATKSKYGKKHFVKMAEKSNKVQWGTVDEIKS